MAQRVAQFFLTMIDAFGEEDEELDDEEVDGYLTMLESIFTSR